jgi:hypothetical protein
MDILLEYTCSISYRRRTYLIENNVDEKKIKKNYAKRRFKRGF